MSPSCSTCKKTDVNLKHCAKCSKTLYCSRDCQKTDWKAHRKVCGKQDGPAASSSSNANKNSSTTTARSPPKGLNQPITKPFTRLDNGTWLHDRPEMDVYRLLIDAYRMRVDDAYKFDGEADEDSIYGGAHDGLRGFRRFLVLAASRPGLLPPWWNPLKQEMCERLGMDASQWYDLRRAIEKSDIIEHYGDPRFPMQLRMFGEAIYLRGPGGADGTPMRKMMAAMEQGSMEDGTRAITIDTTTMNASEV